MMLKDFFRKSEPFLVFALFPMTFFLFSILLYKNIDKDLKSPELKLYLMATLILLSLFMGYYCVKEALKDTNETENQPYKSAFFHSQNQAQQVNEINKETLLLQMKSVLLTLELICLQLKKEENMALLAERMRDVASLQNRLLELHHQMHCGAPEEKKSSTELAGELFKYLSKFEGFKQFAQKDSPPSSNLDSAGVSASSSGRSTPEGK